MNDFKNKMKVLWEKFRTLSMPIQIFAGIFVFLVILILISALFSGGKKSAQPVVVQTTQAPQVTQSQAPVQAPAPAVAPVPAPAADPNQQQPSAAPITSLPTQPTLVTTGSGSVAVKSATAIVPAAPLTVTVDQRLLDRTLQIETSTGVSDFVHDQQTKYGFASTSEHANGIPKQGAHLIAKYVAYVRIEEAGTYSFSASTISEKTQHEVRLFLNDSPVSDSVQVQYDNHNWAGGVISNSLSLVPGYYKIEAVVRQDYNQVAPVGVSVRIKGQSDSAMRDFVPVLISATQSQPEIAPAQAQVQPVAAQPKQPMTGVK
jgi:hypothetical protein